MDCPQKGDKGKGELQRRWNLKRPDMGGRVTKSPVQVGRVTRLRWIITFDDGAWILLGNTLPDAKFKINILSKTGPIVKIDPKGTVND